MAQHTPGPWRVCGGFTPAYTAIHSDAGYIVFGLADATAHHEGIPSRSIKAPEWDTQRANARLIAAAPEMLEALKYISEHILAQHALNEFEQIELNRARALIAKAEGR